MNTRDVTVRVTDVDEMVTGDPLVDRFDDNGNGMIDKEEVIKAIVDYLDEVPGITKIDVIDLIDFYPRQLIQGTQEQHRQETVQFASQSGRCEEGHTSSLGR